MRILLAVHGFPPLQNLGAERAAERIAGWLVSHGHSVEVFTTGEIHQKKTQVQTIEQDGMLVHRISYNVHDGNEFVNLYNNPVIGAALKDVLARGHFDLVHLISGYLLGGQVIEVAKGMNIPVVLTLTEYFFMCPRLNLMHANYALCVGPEDDPKCSRCLLEDMRRFYYLHEASPTVADAFWSVAQNATFARRKGEEVAARRDYLMRRLHQVDLVIAPSRFILEKYAEYGYVHPESVLIQHGVNLPHHPTPQNENERSNPIRFGFIGQIKSHKGVDLLTSAATQLLEAGLPLSVHIWGRTHDSPGYYQRLLKQVDGHASIQFNGAFEGSRVWDVLGSLDVLVVPSRWYENCPTVILEAFKMNIPVIATNLGGMAELVHNGVNGLTFQLNDAADLSHQMQRIITEPGLLPQLRQGIPYIKSAAEEAEEVFALYQRLVAQNHAPTPL